MRKSNVAWVALTLAALLVTGGVFASNMGFKLNYALTGPVGGTLEDGTNTLALPFNQQTGLNDAFDLITDIEATAPGSVIQVARYVKSIDGLESYTGTFGTAFPLVPGEHYRVQVTGAVNYIVVGSHDPSLVVTLTGPVPATAQNGTNTYGYPYHSVSTDAKQLIDEIDAAAGSSVVVSVQKYVKSSGGLLAYTGTSGTAFALAPGEGYRVQVSADVSFVPAHY